MEKAPGQCFWKHSKTLRDAIDLSYLEANHALWVLSDASHRYWPGIVFQVPTEQLKLERWKQMHEPLVFICSEFSSFRLNWKTFEKKSYTIFLVFDRLEYLLLGEQDVHVFNDHRTLSFIISPLALKLTAGRQVISKEQKWAICFVSLWVFHRTCRWRKEHVCWHPDKVYSRLSPKRRANA